MSRDKSKVTIYDVARKAGVAISTVSRVLNNSNDVSDRTKARVQKTIAELQFRPDRTAKSLAQRQNYSLAVAIPTFTTPFHNELLKGIRGSLRDAQIDLLLFDLGSDKPEQQLLSFLKRGAVDGLLLAGVPVDEALTRELKALQAPVVLIGNHHTEFDCFYWDDLVGAEGAVNHLIALGHRRIGMIRAFTDSHLQEQRILGYRKALEQHGLPFDPALICAGRTEKHAGFNEEAGYEAMRGLLDVEPPVTAVFASSDVQAIGAWKAIRDAGMKTPDDIALIGYDDIKTSQFIGLSSMDQSMQEIGQQATALLLRRVRDGRTGKPVEQRVIPTLRVRDSSQASPSHS